MRDFEAAREAAARADEATAKGEDTGPLHGVPMTIKEAYDIEGQPTTWGIPLLAQNLATSDSVTVQRFKGAGAHFLGKTNVPLNLGDFQSYNEIYGTTNNPWDLTRTPGGSSGGSSASLAAGFCALESGSDIGGSIRNPSHYCGVFGHKPTHGIVPQQGHALPGMMAPPDLAVVGPMARSAEDLRLALELVSGPDRFQEGGWTLELPKPAKTSLADFRVAVWPDDPYAPVSTAMSDRVQEIADRLAKLGATVNDRARPAFDPAESDRIYSSLLSGVMSAGIPDEAFDVMIAGAEGLEATRENAALLDTVQRHRSFAKKANLRAGLRLAWKEFFRDWDILICPQVATTAFPHDHSDLTTRTIEVDGTTQRYFQQLFWAGLVTVSHLPSTVFPTGPAADGLPIGLQAVGDVYRDHTCIEFARLMEQELGGFVAPAGYED